ncbi:MAG: SUMF1/EgtB/PvdO family nonheme iron enzyme [Armatimonadota bacterium]|nr:SUMF1/EgtB/PvdO family nonheme iron enzyme [Armatimonadota bacterium]
MQLTPEERRRIYEEEEARIRAERQARARAVRNWFTVPVNLALVIAAVVLIALIVLLSKLFVPTPQGAIRPAHSSASPPASATSSRVPVSPAKAGEVRTNPRDGAKMVWVPAGEFLRGSTDSEVAAMLRGNPKYVQASWCDSEKPQRRIYLDGYWIYKYEVTVTQYRRFCKATGRAMPDPPYIGWKNDRPVDGVTWQDAADYAKWADASLPTEAQWEKAARGTDGRIFPWGNKWNPSRCANSVKRELDGPMPVGSYPKGASPYGCCDMAGNAVEWCADWYDDDETYYATAPSSNPTGPAEGRSRVLRGGSWDFGSAALVTFRCAARGGGDPEKGVPLYGSQGFRCVRMP